MKRKDRSLRQVGWSAMLVAALAWLAVGCQPQGSTESGSVPAVGKLSFMEAYLHLQNRLAQDDGGGAEALAARMVEVAPTDALRKQARSVADAKGIDQVRERLKGLSAETISAVEAGEVELGGSSLYVAHCPMAEASWLQPDKQILNPYYGSEMLHCGEIQKTVAAGSSQSAESEEPKL